MFSNQFKNDFVMLCAKCREKQFCIFGSVMSHCFGPDSHLKKLKKDAQNALNSNG